MWKNFFFSQVFLAVSFLFLVASGSPDQQCFSQGFRLCLDLNGECVLLETDCSDSCIIDTDCKSLICENSYCMASTAIYITSSAGVNYLLIFLPQIFGFLFVTLLSYYCCWRRARQNVLLMQSNANPGSVNMNIAMQQQMEIFRQNQQLNLLQQQHIIMQQLQDPQELILYQQQITQNQQHPYQTLQQQQEQMRMMLHQHQLMLQQQNPHQQYEVMPANNISGFPPINNAYVNQVQPNYSLITQPFPKDNKQGEGKTFI